MTNAAVVLDLDNTLVHSLLDTVPRPDTTLETFRVCHPDTSIGYTVHLRPHVKAFLQYLVSQRHFVHLVIWTAGSPWYAKEIVDKLFTHVGLAPSVVSHILDRSDAILLPSGEYVKNVNMVCKRLGVSQVMLLDDNPVHKRLKSNVGRVVTVTPFFCNKCGAEEDSFLKDLITSLDGGFKTQQA